MTDYYDQTKNNFLYYQNNNGLHQSIEEIEPFKNGKWLITFQIDNLLLLERIFPDIYSLEKKEVEILYEFAQSKIDLEENKELILLATKSIASCNYMTHNAVYYSVRAIGDYPKNKAKKLIQTYLYLSALFGTISSQTIWFFTELVNEFSVLEKNILIELIAYLKNRNELEFDNRYLKNIIKLVEIYKYRAKEVYENRCKQGINIFYVADQGLLYGE